MHLDFLMVPRPLQLSDADAGGEGIAEAHDCGAVPLLPSLTSSDVPEASLLHGRWERRLESLEGLVLDLLRAGPDGI